ncbi:MAG: hypothetical protein ACLPTF_14850 [Steroidobacteraceae bacterium]
MANWEPPRLLDPAETALPRPDIDSLEEPSPGTRVLRHEMADVVRRIGFHHDVAGSIRSGRVILRQVSSLIAENPINQH